MAMVRNVIEQKAHFPSPSRSFGIMILWNTTLLYLEYCQQIWFKPQKTNTKVYFMLMQVTQYK